MSDPLVQALVKAVASAELKYATKGSRRAAFEAQAAVDRLISQLSEDASKAAGLALALHNLANEMRHLLRVNPAKDGGLYRQRLNEADAILEVKP